MEISNSKQIIKYKLTLRGITFVFLGLIILSFFDSIKMIYNLPRHYYTILFIILFLIFALLMYAKDAVYVMFNEDYDQISFKYYKLKLFKGERKNLIIKKDTLYKYEIDKKGFYKYPYITLYVKTKKGIAKYELINLGLFKQKDVNNLLSILDKSIKN